MIALFLIFDLGFSHALEHVNGNVVLDHEVQKLKPYVIFYGKLQMNLMSTPCDEQLCIGFGNDLVAEGQQHQRVNMARVIKNYTNLP